MITFAYQRPGRWPQHSDCPRSCASQPGCPILTTSTQSATANRQICLVRSVYVASKLANLKRLCGIDRDCIASDSVGSGVSNGQRWRPIRTAQSSRPQDVTCLVGVQPNSTQRADRRPCVRRAAIQSSIMLLGEYRIMTSAQRAVLLTRVRRVFSHAALSADAQTCNAVSIHQRAGPSLYLSYKCIATAKTP